MRPAEAERQLPLFDPLSMAVLHVLEQHQDCVFDKHVRGFLAAVCDYVGSLSELTKVGPNSDSEVALVIPKPAAEADLCSTVALVRAAAEKKKAATAELPRPAPAETGTDPSMLAENEEQSVESLVAASLGTGSEHGMPGSSGRGSVHRDAQLVAPSNTAATAKALLTSRFGQSKSITEDLVNLFFSLFHSVCDDAQSLVEISAAAKQHRQMRQQQWRWESNGESSAPAGAGGDFGEGVTAAHLLLWRYADAISTALESYCGALRVAGCVSSSGNSRSNGGGASSSHGAGLDILSEHSLAIEPWSSSGKNADAGAMEIYSEPKDHTDEGDLDGGLGSDSGSDTSEHSSGSLSSSRSARAGGARAHRSKRRAGKSSKSSSFRFNSQAFVSTNAGEESYGTLSTAVVSLLASKVLSNVLPGMISRMENSLRAFGMSISGGGSTSNSSRIRDKVTSRVSFSSHMLLLAFIENRYDICVINIFSALIFIFYIFQSC